MEQKSLLQQNNNASDSYLYARQGWNKGNKSAAITSARVCLKLNKIHPQSFDLNFSEIFFGKIDDEVSRISFFLIVSPLGKDNHCKRVEMNDRNQRTLLLKISKLSGSTITIYI